jgi:murein L,D-transpeptidase YcbB/YkuD
MSRALLLVSSCVVVAGLTGACGEDDAAAAIRAALGSAGPPVPAVVREVYRERDYRPLWTRGGGVTPAAGELIETLCHAEREGLRPADYHFAALGGLLERLRRGGAGPDVAAALDVRLTSLFVAYGSDLLAGRLDPAAVDSAWYIRTRRAGIDSVLRVALREDDFDDMIAPLRPRQREYAELREALAGYRELQRRGGWVAVPGRGGLRPGDRGPRVAALRERLRATGELDAPADARPVYDGKLAAAVARFQERHGIPPSGEVDAATLAALNVPVEARILQIELNLERYRWLPSDFGTRYIVVNIPDYLLHAYDGGKERFQMRVIVGGEYASETPVFADSMTQVVFRPYWNVPRSILVDELLPKVRKNIYYLTEHDFEVVDTAGTGTVIHPAAIDWDDLNPARLPFRVRQKPGRANAVGAVKFLFPNRFNVYLHDTPAGELFDSPERTLSHGCVRVEFPARLAGFVLDGQDGWDEDRIRRAMAAGSAAADPREESVTLERPVPVYLLYLTAFVRDGGLHFRGDPYGKDHRGLARIAAAPAGAGRTACEQLKKLAGG